MAKSSCEWSPLWLHHKIDWENPGLLSMSDFHDLVIQAHIFQKNPLYLSQPLFYLTKLVKFVQKKYIDFNQCFLIGDISSKRKITHQKFENGVFLEGFNSQKWKTYQLKITRFLELVSSK
jgi:hypothetical protein